MSSTYLEVLNFDWGQIDPEGNMSFLRGPVGLVIILCGFVTKSKTFQITFSHLMHY